MRTSLVLVSAASAAIVVTLAGCGSDTSGGASGPNDQFGTSSGGASGYTCQPDADGGISPKGVHALDLSNALCPPGTHAVPTAGSSGSSGNPVGSAGGNGGGSSGTSGSSGASGSSGNPVGTGGGGASSGGPVPPPPPLCTLGGVNNEANILVGYAPSTGQSVGANGQIKVWVNDERAPIIAPGEVVDSNTGAIVTPGDRTAKAADGYLWEPALYIAPNTAEAGGTPHFPTAIKGRYNNNPTQFGAGTLVAGMDPPPAGSVLASAYTGEDIWDVASLGLAPGQYMAEFVIHDGDRERAVGCVVISITK